MAKVSFQMPSMEGAGLEPRVEDAFGSVGGAIQEFSEQVSRELNLARMVNVPGRGRVPLDRFAEEYGAFKDAVWWFAGTWAAALRKKSYGWVIANGAYGTPNLLGAFIRGVSAREDAGGAGGADTHFHGVGTYDIDPHTGHVHGLTGATDAPDACALVCSCGGDVWVATDAHVHNLVGTGATVSEKAAPLDHALLGSSESVSSVPAHIKLIPLVKRW